MSEALADMPQGGGRSASPGSCVLDACREALATLLGVPDPLRIVLTTSATHALNIAIAGLRLKRGDRVITTCAEHNSVLRPLFLLREERKAKVDVIGLDRSGEISQEEFRAKLDHKPRLVVLTHASNVTGRVFDVQRLLSMAKRVGAVTLLDASQSIGHLPVRPTELNADLVAFPGHKALRGPAGTGALYVAPGVELAPFLTGGTGILSESLHQPREMPLGLEPGTPNVPAFAGLLAALRWMARDGQAMSERGAALAATLRSALVGIPGVVVIDNQGPAPRLALVSFRIAGRGVNEVGTRLAEDHNIVCRAGLHCAPLIHRSLGTAPEGTIRFSISGAIADADIAAALDAVRALIP